MSRSRRRCMNASFSVINASSRVHPLTVISTSAALLRQAETAAIGADTVALLPTLPPSCPGLPWVSSLLVSCERTAVHLKHLD
ncbi:hypothetical protein B0H14DRAFT_3527194 [Mycena olivaceomarginata]|nr:hypothetical protein B0H14DRAFT_3527194 [Mycena olivaceomarginata]